MNLRGAFYTPYSLSRGAPSASWVLPQVDGKIQLAERVGFEPTDAFTSPVFKTGAFNRSAISPFVKANLCQKQIRFYHPRSRLSTQNARSRRINISRRSRGYFLCGQSPMCQPRLMRRWYGLTSAWDLLLAARKRAQKFPIVNCDPDIPPPLRSSPFSIRTTVAEFSSSAVASFEPLAQRVVFGTQKEGPQPRCGPLPS